MSEHPGAPPRRVTDEHWRQHKHLALEVGKNEVARMEAHYRDHGILVSHRKTKDGLGYEPVCTSLRDYERCLESRGMTNCWGAE